MVGIYLVFAHSFLRGLAIVALVGVLHFVTSKVADGLMLLRQKTMPEEELQAYALGWQFGRRGAVPPAFGRIATVCGLVFFCSAVGLIWYFLTL
jgi:flagellar motor component MotA